MADDTEVIGIISALNEAGLLGTAPAGSGAAGVIGALRDAGLLVTGGAAAGGAAAGGGAAPGAGAPPSSSLPTLPVGYVDYLVDVLQVIKAVTIDSSGEQAEVTFRRKVQDGRTADYLCTFPPNDRKFLPEIDRLLATPKPVMVAAVMEITNVAGSDRYNIFYEGNLQTVWGAYETPPPPRL